MNTKALAKCYGALATHERFAARYAASIRGDDAEVARLEQSEPKTAYRMGDGTLFGHAVHALVHEYVLQQLDKALLMERLLSAFGSAQEEAKGGGKKAKPPQSYAEDPFRLYHAAKYVAFKLLAMRTAFVRFMGRLKLDPAPMLKLQTGAEAVADALDHAEGLAFTAEEARTRFLARHGEEAEFEDDRNAEALLYVLFRHHLRLWSQPDPLAAEMGPTLAALALEAEAAN